MHGLVTTLFPDSAIVTSEVVDALREIGDIELRWRCIEFYVSLQRDLPVEEDLESPGEWVTGRIAATMAEIREVCPTNGSHFNFDDVWRALIDAKIIVGNDETITLPLLIRKADLLNEGRGYLERLEARKEKQ